MTKLQCYVLNRFSLSDETIDTNQLVKIFTAKNVDFESGFQILNINIISSSRLGIETLKRSPTYLLDFDRGNAEFVRRESFLFTKSFFEINLEHHYLITFGSLSQNNDAKEFLKRTGLSYTMDQLYIDIADFYESSGNIYEDVLLKAITIKKFNYRNGIVGRFSGEIVDHSVVFELLETYSKDLLKATFAIKDGQYKFDLQTFPNGAFKILTNHGDHREILENLTPHLLK